MWGTAALGCPAAQVHRAAAGSAGVSPAVVRASRSHVQKQAVEEIPIRTYNLCFLGYGNVNRTLVRLLEDRAEELRTRHGIAYRITGIASRSLGWIADPNGLDPNTLCGAGAPARGKPAADPNRSASQLAASTVRDWLT